MLDNSFSVNDVDTVSINNFSGIRSAVSYLARRGHSKIGYIRSRVGINSFSDRFAAYKLSLEAFSLPFDERYVATVGYSDFEARQGMYDYIQSAEELPTAFVSDNDLIACGALKGIQDAGLEVPRDISLIGFDDRPISSMSDPTISTMMVPKDEFGNNCVDLLLDKIATKRNYAVKIEFGTILVERESVCSRESNNG